MVRPFRLLPVLVWLIAESASATAQPEDLQKLFKTELGLAATKLKLKPDSLDDDVGLAVVCSGVSWRPSAGGFELFTGAGSRLAYTGWQGRYQGWQAARSSRDELARFAFAFSLVVSPGGAREEVRQEAYADVDRYGDGWTRVLVGVMGADDRIPFLHTLAYSAADLLVLRADPRDFPLFVSMAGSADKYLKSRGITALGVLCWTERPAWKSSIVGFRFEPRDVAISARLRSMCHELIVDAADDRSYRVRAAAALAMGMAGFDDAPERLQRLLRDKAYLSYAGSEKGIRQIVFPVRATAAAALQRFGYPATAGGGVLRDKELKAATRGGKDVTHDTKGLKRGMSSDIRFHNWEW